jgi:hypothetical protein
MDYFSEDNPIAKLNAAAMKARERFAAVERFSRAGLDESVAQAAAQEAVEDMIAIASKSPELWNAAMKDGEIDRLQQMARVGADANESIGARDVRLRNARGAVEAIMDLEAGRISADECSARVSEIVNGPAQPEPAEQAREFEDLADVPDRDKVVDATSYIEAAAERQRAYDADARANLERNSRFRGGEIE